MKPAYGWMRAAWLGAILLAGGTALVAPAEAAAPAPQSAPAGAVTCGTPEQNPPYTLGEYNAYKAADGEKDPQKKIAMLDGLVTQCPNSALMPYIFRAYYLAYYQLKNYGQTLSYVDKLLALGTKVDLGSRLEAEVARAQAFLTASSDPAFQTPAQYTAARDAAARGLATLAEWKKPDNQTEEQFAAQRKNIGVIFNTVTGLADNGLKDYQGAQRAYKALLTIDPTDALAHYQLGVADLAVAPPATMDGYWEMARAIALKAQGAPQIQAYLRGQIVRYQQLGCDKLADDELNQLLALAASGNDHPASFALPGAEDLHKAQQDTADFMRWLQEGGDHGRIMWLATCGLEFSDFPVKVIEVRPGSGDNVTLEVFHSSAADPDAAGKEMEAATTANMEVHVVGQPDAKRIMKDDYVRFTGTLSGYQPMPFQLNWDSAKVNAEDLPSAKPAPKTPAPARRPAPRAPSK